MEGRPADDAELFARAQRGSIDAYEEIVQRYQQLAFRTAYGIPPSDCRDLALRFPTATADMPSPLLSEHRG